MVPHSSTLAWKIPWTEEPSRLQSMGSLRVGYDWATSLSFSLSCIGEGNGNPLQYSCLENPRDGGAWWAAVYGVTQSRTRLKWLSSSSRHKATRINDWHKITHWGQGTASQASPMGIVSICYVQVSRKIELQQLGNGHTNQIMGIYTGHVEHLIHSVAKFYILSYQSNRRCQFTAKALI